MSKVDETIDVICDWIQAEFKHSASIQNNSVMPEIIKALAELVSAREWD